MTDDEIVYLIHAHHAISGEINDVIIFARAIEYRTLTNQKAKWYQEGVESEREACARLCQEFLAMECADAIRTRGE